MQECPKACSAALPTLCISFLRSLRTENEISHQRWAPYMSVRCRRVGSSLGTAVKWFPSRYLKERCRVTLGKETMRTLPLPQDASPDFPGWTGSLFCSLMALFSPTSKHILHLSSNIYLCDCSINDTFPHWAAKLHDGRALA